jgi:hypothetical protein
MKKGGIAGGGKRGNDIEMNVPKPNFILQMKMNYVASENKNSH